MRFKLMIVTAVIMLSGLATLANAGRTPNLTPGPVGPGAGTCPNPAAPDHDGDGIPNGLDPDYVPPRDGTGRQLGRGEAISAPMSWLDLLPARYGIGLGFCGGRLGWLGGGYGPGDGTGNDGTGPGDGTGYGPGDGGGIGECDGTGPNGRRAR